MRIKKCPDCGETNIEKFTKNKRAPGGFNKRCKKCWKKRYRKIEPKRILTIPPPHLRCQVAGCFNKFNIKKHKLCNKHYKEQYKTNEPPKIIMYSPYDCIRNINWTASKTGGNIENDYGR